MSFSSSSFLVHFCPLFFFLINVFLLFSFKHFSRFSLLILSSLFVSLLSFFLPFYLLSCNFSVSFFFQSLYLYFFIFPFSFILSCFLICFFFVSTSSNFKIIHYQFVFGQLIFFYFFLCHFCQSSFPSDVIYIFLFPLHICFIFLLFLSPFECYNCFQRIKPLYFNCHLIPSFLSYLSHFSLLNLVFLSCLFLFYFFFSLNGILI